MKAVIQAGGFGTRLAALTKNEIPKPLLPIGGTPIIERQICTLSREGVRDFLIITGHLGTAIEKYLGDGSAFGVSIRYFQEPIPLGSGGALAYLPDLLDGEDFLLVNGDLVFDFDLERMTAFHRKKSALATLFVHPNSHPYDSDLLRLDHDGHINGFDSKHNTRDYWYENSINAGIFILNPTLIKALHPGKKLSFEQDILYLQIKRSAAIYGYRSPEYVHDAGTPERVAQAEADISSGLVAARNLKRRQKAVFLDRDGTLNRDAGFVYTPEQLGLLPGVAEAVGMLNRSGFLALCVTNQSVVARGLCTEDDVREIHRKLDSLLGCKGAYLDDIAFCPHHPDKGYPEERPEYKITCECRKPGIEMITYFANKYNIDLSQSWMIGDSQVDVQAGINAGLRTILLTKGDTEKKCTIEPDIICEDIERAVQRLLSDRHTLP